MMQNLSSFKNILRLSTLFIVTLVSSSIMFAPALRADEPKTLTQAFDQAAQARQKGDWNEERVAWENAVNLSPTPGEKAYTKLQLGGVLNVLKNFDLAREQLEEALGLSVTLKGKTQIKRALYTSLLGLKELDRADVLRQELKQAPDDLMSAIDKRLLDISFLQAQGKWKEAGEETEKMMWDFRESFPNVKFTPEGKFAPVKPKDMPQLQYGFVLGDISGMTPAQVQAALEKVAKDPKAAPLEREQAKIFVGDFLIYHNKPAEARDFYLGAKVLFPGTSAEQSLISKIGDTYAAERNWDKAVEYYNRALTVPSDIPFGKNEIQAKRDLAARYAAKK